MGRLSERGARAARATVQSVGAHATGVGERARAGVHALPEPDQAMRPTALHAEYDRRIGVAHAVAVPLFVDDDTLVSFVLNRAGRDFDERDVLEGARAAVARYRAWFAAEGWCELEVDAQCRIRRADRRARTLLGAAVPAADLRRGAVLPPALVAWLTRSPGRGPAGSALTLTGGARAARLGALRAGDECSWLR